MEWHREKLALCPHCGNVSTEIHQKKPRCIRHLAVSRPHSFIISWRWPLSGYLLNKWRKKIKTLKKKPWGSAPNPAGGKVPPDPPYAREPFDCSLWPGVCFFPFFPPVIEKLLGLSTSY